MSVIENALKKLQAQSRSANQHSPTEVNPHGVFGAIQGGASSTSRKHDAAPTRELPVPTRTISIDQAALRVAGLLPPEHQDRELQRQYRRIKRPLIEKALGRGEDRVEGGNLIMVASAMPGEGKTFMSLNLAFSIAREKDTSVLLVDGDVAKPQISQLLGVGNEPGLLDLLRAPNMDVESTVIATDVPQLYVLPAGRQSENATELLASHRMHDVLTQFGRNSASRIVIFDSPPLLLTTESQVLAQALGQIVVVVRADFTPQRALMDALEILGAGKSVSLVLNQSLHSPHSDYHYYYNNDEQRDRSPAT